MSAFGPGLVESYGLAGGFQQPLDGTAPAAGSSFALKMDGTYVSRLVSCVFTLTTDNNAANRFVTVEYQQSDGTPFCVNGAGLVVTASTTQRFAGSITRGQAEWAANTDVFFPLEPVFLEGGVTLAIKVGAIQAGDTLTVIRFLFDRFRTGQDARRELAA